MKNTLNNAVSMIWSQKLWLIIVSSFLALFTYGQVTGTRILNSSADESWTPSGPDAHTGGTHYYRGFRYHK